MNKIISFILLIGLMFPALAYSLEPAKWSLELEDTGVLVGDKKGYSIYQGKTERPYRICVDENSPKAVEVYRGAMSWSQKMKIPPGNCSDFSSTYIIIVSTERSKGIKGTYMLIR